MTKKGAKRQPITPVKLEFYQEEGVTYRPFKSVERIKAIDRKKKSRIDPRLIIPGVDHNYLNVWNVSETSSPSCIPSSPSPPSSPPTQIVQNSTASVSYSPEPHNSPSQYYMPCAISQPVIDDSAFHLDMPSGQLPLKLEDSVHHALEFNSGSQLFSFVDPVHGVSNGATTDVSYQYNLQCQPQSLVMQSFDPSGDYLGLGPENEVDAVQMPMLGPAFFSGYAEAISYPQSEFEVLSSYSASPPPSSPTDSYESDSSWSSYTPPPISSTSLDYSDTDSRHYLESCYDPSFGSSEYIEPSFPENEVCATGDWGSVAA